jgi:electron transfer flavoprotein alpha/beta subunit
MSPRVFVQVWCEIDPTLNVRVDRQTGDPHVENGDVLMRASPVGRFGITTALEMVGSQVVAFCLGNGHEPALRHALAAGAARAVQLTLAAGDVDMGWVVSLAEWLREQEPDLVIADRIAGRVAARLGWAHLAGLDQLQLNDGQLWAIRHLGRGDCESVTAKLPATVRLQTETPRLRYISQARLADAGSRAIEQIALNVPVASSREAEVGSLQLSRPRTRLGTVPGAASTSGLDRLSALMGVGRVAAAPSSGTAESAQKTPDEMAEEFVRYLAHHNLLNDL